jgi:DNA-binding CsgD family transcriptional regulator
MDEVHTLWVARRVSSRQLVGRSDQLAALRSAAQAAASESARVLLVAGDAGIGKTRLLTEAAARARADGFVTALGGCLQLGEVSVAYAPLLEALRDLRTQLGEDAFTELLGPGRVDIGALLGGSPAGSGAVAQSSGPLFEHVLGVLSRLGQRQPVMLVFEDLHWADASTRDLVAFLARNLRDARVVLVLTYRADELHRRHPLRPVIADLERGTQVERVTLSGLDRDAFVQLLGEISDDPVPDDLVDELLTRSEGNPFYVEELMAAGGLGQSLPATLADVILDRVSRLSESTQAVLHDAAVLGYEVDDVLLAQVTGQPIAAVTAALREAVFDQLLVIDGDACRFRHALVREALYDDLLPGERERLHVAAAEALAASDRLDEHVRWALLAHHWDAAGMPVKAFAASLNAGKEAERVHAFADAAAQFDRALRLYDRLPDPGLDKADLLLWAASANDASRGGQRSIDLARAALREMDRPGQDAPPEQRALVYERIGRYNWGQHDAAATAAYEKAVALLEDRPASREQAFTMATLGQSLMLRNLYGESESVLQRAIAIAREVDAGSVEAHALCSLGPVQVGTGRADEGLATMRRAQELTFRLGSDEEQCRSYTNLTHCLYLSGHYDEAAKAGAEGVEVTIRTGFQRAYGQSILGNWIMAMVCAGRWDEAEAVRADPRILAGDPYQELRWLSLLFARGRLAEAGPLVEQVLADTVHADDMQFRGQALLRAAELAATADRWDDARAQVAEVLALAESGQDQYYRSQAYGLGLTIEADRPAPSSPEVADRLASAAQAWGASLAAQLPEVRAWLAVAAASRSRVHGRDTADEWDAVAAIWDEVGQPFRAAQARYRQADALLRARARDEASALLREVLRVAASLGAVLLETQVRQLAQRARVVLTSESAVAPDPVAALNLTPRELDVLALLAQGRTNRQIGEALFISEKTASVHVTNLLRKLSVPNRIEAAAIGQRVGL